MDDFEAVAAAGFDTYGFLDHFKDMPHYRQPGKVAYRLDEDPALVAVNWTPFVGPRGVGFKV